jgi:predicted TIM-barrel fold metal-dependent hydrolase
VIVDAHCHAWRRWPYQPPVPDPDSRGRIEQLLFEMQENLVDQAVVICARLDENADNNDYVAAEAAKRPGRLHPFLDVDCEWTPMYHRPGAAARLRETAERWPIKGFTHYLTPENDGWLVSADGMAFFETAAELGLIASLSAHPPWQADIRRVAAAFPSLPIICHHMGFVRASESPPFPELSQVLESAALPNILVKVSGFYYGSTVDWDFPYSDTARLVRILYEHFGPYRLCWGSDYPVCLRFVTYRQSIEALRSHCPFIPAADKEWILGRTLARLLDTGTPPDGG